MPFTNGKASPPLSIGDIARYFGHADGDLGSLITYILTNKLVNPFSLSKPVRSSNVGLVNRGSSLAVLGFGNISSVSSTSNPSLPSAASAQGLIDLYADGDSNTLYSNVRANGWRYLAPRGVGNGITEYYRIADFFKVLNNAIVSSSGEYGYDEGAKNPFGTLTLTPENISSYGGQLTVRNQHPVPQGAEDEHYLTITDFNTYLSSGQAMDYYGVLLVPVNSSGNWDSTYGAHIIANNSTTIHDNLQYRGHEEMEVTYNLTSGAWRIGNYKAYPFIATGVLSSTSTIIDISYNNRYNTFQDNARLYPLPGTTPAILNVFGAPIQITVHTGDVVPTVGGGYLIEDVYFTVENRSSSTVNISTFYLKFRFSPHTYSDARTAGEVDYSDSAMWNDSYPGGTSFPFYYTLLQGMTVAAGTTETSDIQDVTLPSSTSDRFYIGCSYNGIDAPSSAVVVRLPSDNQ